jgi:nucleoside-diphosphate-sugar epimerase
MSTDLVTGAFGYTGSRIATRLLDSGRVVVTLTRRAHTAHPLEGRVRRLAYDFDDANLRAALNGIDTVYVTYWMRFPRGTATWDEMVANVARLATAAGEAGVRRLVYVSVSNASHDALTAYFRAKAAAEDAVRGAAGSNDAAPSAAAAMSVAIIRPTLLYGPSDILINNMAWSLRRLPVFGIPGDGSYLVQPVHVDDVADLAVDLGAADGHVVTDAAGPETTTFNDLVATVRRAVRSRAIVRHMPVPVVLGTTSLLGLLVRDTVLTRDEITELSSSYLASKSQPTGNTPTRFSEWIAANASTAGKRWSSELERNFRSVAAQK